MKPCSLPMTVCGLRGLRSVTIFFSPATVFLCSASLVVVLVAWQRRCDAKISDSMMRYRWRNYDTLWCPFYSFQALGSFKVSGRNFCGFLFDYFFFLYGNFAG